MTLKSLGEGLRDLADAVETVDMRDRALAASQRLRARRTATGVAGAVAVLLVGLLGFKAVWTDQTAPNAVPAAERPVAVPALPAPTGVTGVAEDLSGDFYYLAQPLVGDAGAAGGQSLLRWSGDGDPQVLADDLPLTGTASVSPDGRYLSFVETGELMLRELATGSEWAVMPVSDDQTCVPPVWAPDGRRLLVHTGEPGTGGPVGFYDITTATFTQIGDVPGCHVKVWQDGDGRDMINYTTYGEGTQLTRLREVNSAESEAGYDWGILEGKWMTQPFSVSPDGDAMCAATVSPRTFPDAAEPRTDYCDTVVRLENTGKGPAVAEIPVGADETLMQAVMFRDGFVARAFGDDGETTLTLHDDKGEILDGLSEPMWDYDPVLVAYVP